MRLKGVIWAGTSPGSNHDGARVTCQAQTNSPAARVWAPARGVRTIVRAATTRNHTTCERNRIMLFLLQTMTSAFETRRHMHCGYISQVPGSVAILTRHDCLVSTPIYMKCQAKS